ncbi:UPF0149 family protein [Roseibium sediminis]|uniref:UPF0149 family protein n=1 Tax=Roseibium sediminis TaxID=1775174 RepID=UPI00123DBB8E|nr:UPF0149 family protein [Roseibium sediminis]
MTSKLSRRLLKLDAFLHSEAVDEDAMLLSELDGFLAGVIVCPDLIAPSEWLPLIWGEELPDFKNEKHAQDILDLIMGHYNDIIRQLNQRRYSPIYNIDIDGSPLWELWVDGFHQAMQLQPAAWLIYEIDAEEDLQNALFVIARLMEIATEPNAKPEDIDQELENIAADVIPSQIEVLHHARLKLQTPDTHAGPITKVGWNDPCPCGAGKKYKRCCGLK